MKLSLPSSLLLAYYYGAPVDAFTASSVDNIIARKSKSALFIKISDPGREKAREKSAQHNVFRYDRSFQKRISNLKDIRNNDDEASVRSKAPRESMDRYNDEDIRNSANNNNHDNEFNTGDTKQTAKRRAVYDVGATPGYAYNPNQDPLKKPSYTDDQEQPYSPSSNVVDPPPRMQQNPYIDPRLEREDPRFEREDPRFEREDPRFEREDPRLEREDPRYAAAAQQRGQRQFDPRDMPEVRITDTERSARNFHYGPSSPPVKPLFDHNTPITSRENHYEQQQRHNAEQQQRHNAEQQQRHNAEQQQRHDAEQQQRHDAEQQQRYDAEQQQRYNAEQQQRYNPEQQQQQRYNPEQQQRYNAEQQQHQQRQQQYNIVEHLPVTKPDDDARDRRAFDYGPTCSVVIDRLSGNKDTSDFVATMAAAAGSLFDHNKPVMNEYDRQDIPFPNNNNDEFHYNGRSPERRNNDFPSSNSNSAFSYGPVSSINAEYAPRQNNIDFENQIIDGDYERSSQFPRAYNDVAAAEALRLPEPFYNRKDNNQEETTHNYHNSNNHNHNHNNHNHNNHNHNNNYNDRNIPNPNVAVVLDERSSRTFSYDSSSSFRYDSSSSLSSSSLSDNSVVTTPSSLDHLITATARSYASRNRNGGSTVITTTPSLSMTTTATRVVEKKDEDNDRNKEIKPTMKALEDNKAFQSLDALQSLDDMLKKTSPKLTENKEIKPTVKAVEDNKVDDVDDFDDALQSLDALQLLEDMLKKTASKLTVNREIKPTIKAVEDNKADTLQSLKDDMLKKTAPKLKANKEIKPTIKASKLTANKEIKPTIKAAEEKKTGALQSLKDDMLKKTAPKLTVNKEIKPIIKAAEDKKTDDDDYYDAIQSLDYMLKETAPRLTSLADETLEAVATLNRWGKFVRSEKKRLKIKR